MNNKLEDTEFPQYRRYKNGLSYFKILSAIEFEEIKLIGNKRIVMKVVAKQYPEMVFVRDLLFNFSEFAEVIGEGEYAGVSPHE